MRFVNCCERRERSKRSSWLLAIRRMACPALTNHFINGDPYRCRQVEGPDVSRKDRHCDKSVSITFVQLRRQASRFTAENKDDIARVGEGHVPEESLRLRREEVWDAQCWQFLLERVPTSPHVRGD